MTKKSKKTSTELVKPLTKEEVKERLLRTTYYEEHPDAIYNKFWKLLTKDLKDWNEEENKFLNQYIRSINNISKSHVPLAETQQEWSLRTTVIEMTNDIIKEYNCNTTLEKSLCEIIANSYWKTLQISKKITTCMNAWEYLSNERTKYLSMLSMELDRANRNYLNALNNLIELKKPQMNINIKTKNAYIGQNQQFNNNLQENENIKD